MSADPKQTEHVFKSTDELYAVMKDLFDYMSANPDNIKEFLKAKMVVRIYFTDPKGIITVDGRTPPMEAFFGSMPGKADFEVALPADLLHEIWTSRTSLSKNFMAGNIKTKGNLFKALSKLENLFHGAEDAYPQFIEKYGLEAPKSSDKS